tara:strand:+ start:91 stop:321 length:231 start_codon:yes stop_codon:yes gene_type:complete
MLKNPKEYADELSSFIGVISVDDIVKQVSSFPGIGPKYLEDLRTRLELEKIIQDVEQRNILIRFDYNFPTHCESEV